MEKIQMKEVVDLKFPSLAFSPLATSSPKLTRMRTTRDHSWASSSDESSGNVTTQAITGIDESHMDASKIAYESSLPSFSMHTALEYVNPTVFVDRPSVVMLTREELKSAIAEWKITQENYSACDANIYATVVTERILWTACRTWSGTLPMASKDIFQHYLQYACSDWYMRNTGLLCADELQHISNCSSSFDWQSVAVYCYGKGMPTKIIDRIFTANLVRRTTGDCLDATEMTWLLFAMIGTDEMQSIEYWFRVLDVDSVGVLSLSDLQMFYGEITKFLEKDNVQSLPFANVITQFTDILGTDKWTLRSFKRKSDLAFRVINGFVNAFQFLEQEINEKTNGERMDDEEFGQGSRTRWQRLIDHEYDSYYQSC